MAGLPDLLTVEEAAEVIRVGRTKAYAMAREWRATGGRSGLPVIDFGHVLRVPRCQLETIVGGPLSVGSAATLDPAPAPAQVAADAQAVGSSPAAPVPTPAHEDLGEATPSPDPVSTPVRSPGRPPRRRAPAPDQPTLPFTS